MDQKVTIEEIAMMLGQKDIEIMVLQKQIKALQEELTKMPEEPRQ